MCPFDKENMIMEQYKKEFIEFMIDCNVLKFGDFVTKSGRKTPFFVNTGFYRTGSQLKRLGEYYAEGPEMDEEKSFEYFEDAHIHGFKMATLKVAECYYLGKGVVQDKDYSFELAKKLYDEGYEEAQEFLQKYF